MSIEEGAGIGACDIPLFAQMEAINFVMCTQRFRPCVGSSDSSDEEDLISDVLPPLA